MVMQIGVGGMRWWSPGETHAGQNINEKYKDTHNSMLFVIASELVSQSPVSGRRTGRTHARRVEL